MMYRPVAMLCDCAECYEARNPVMGQMAPPLIKNGEIMGLAHRVCRRCERELTIIPGVVGLHLCDRCGGYTVVY